MKTQPYDTTSSILLRRSAQSIGMSRLLVAAVLALPVSLVCAQTPQKILPVQGIQNLSPTIYSSTFICGSQRQLSVNTPVKVEPGRYSTTLAILNPSSTPRGTVGVFASTESETAVPVANFNLQAFESKEIGCEDIFAALGALPVPDATVGYIYVMRFQDDLEVQTIFSRTTQSSDGDTHKGAAIDVERIHPRQTYFNSQN